jgi:preprotein translocase subunit SecA
MGMKEGDAIEHPWLSKNVERAQRKVEERNFQVRKNILEYDEVMEHQRQHFYGLRQRVLEGRDVKGLIFEYIEDAIDDAIAEMLDVEYPALCAAEFARERLDVSIPPERLRGKDINEMDTAIRKIAKEEATHMIDITIGEYMPMEGSEISVDFDSAGLARWAKNRFGVEVDPGELREGGAAQRREVQYQLEQAAFDQIDRADLEGSPSSPTAITGPSSSPTGSSASSPSRSPSRRSSPPATTTAATRASPSSTRPASSTASARSITPSSS